MMPARAVAIFERKLDYLRERQSELEPGWGSWSWNEAEMEAIELALSVLRHKASIERQDRARLHKAYNVGYVPDAAP